MAKETNQTQETYVSHCEDYLKKFKDNGPRKKDIEEVFALTTKQNPIVIEFGCAGGRDAEIIIKHTKSYTGIDYIPEFIAHAKQAVPHGKFLVEDLETYTPSNEVDIVFAFASLLHSNKQILTKVFQRIHSSLSQEGLVRVSLKHAENYTEHEERDSFGTRIFYYYSVDDIAAMCTFFTILFIRKETHAGKEWLEILLQK